MSSVIPDPFWASAEKAAFLKQRAETFWNRDYLERIVLPLLLSSPCERILDVGCGYGALTLLLAQLLSDTQFIGLDLEAKAIQSASQAATQLELTNIHFLEGDAYHLPFEKNSFDAIVCQTFLTHVADPVSIIEEMSRVLKQGGVLMTVEYQNIGRPILLDNLSDEKRDANWYSEMFRLIQLFIAGKKVLGRGDETVGIRIPFIAHDAGLEIFDIRLNDRVSYAIPPYMKGSEHETLKLLNWVYKDEWDTVEKAWESECICAGGGTAEDCERYFALLATKQDRLALRQALLEGKYMYIQAMLTYLTFARKQSARSFL